VLSATPLAPWPEGQALPIVARGESTFVVGWRSEDLVGAGAALE
jgi:hypothetical protein